jgi:SAM-dependent methyltransferase
MTIVLVGFVLLLACFASVLMVGAPYLPTLTPQVKAALELADLKSGDTLLELGCGDGRVLVAAAEQGLKVVGYEINPLMVVVAWLRTRRYRSQVRVVWGNFWHKAWPPADAIFVFLLPKYMKKLDTKIVQYDSRTVKLASFAFKIPSKHIVREKQGVYLYEYR